MLKFASFTTLRFICLLTPMVVSCPTTLCMGQLPKVADSRLGVDVVRLTTGQRLYGFVLAKEASGELRFAVEREWLAATYPDYFQQQLVQETQAAESARDELTGRIREWREHRQDDELLVGFLDAELDRIVRQPQELPDDKLFMVLTVAASSVREVTIQNAEPRKIAGLAYQHGIDKVVTTPASLLKKRLTAIDVNPVEEQVDLSSQVPQVQSQSTRQWAARKALVEFQMREKLEYQGTGTTMIRKGESTDVAALMGQLLAGGSLDPVAQLGAELGLPEFQQFKKKDNDWWRKPTREAEQDGFIGVLLTRLEQDLLSPNVTVETHFYAMESPGNWFPVFKLRSVSNANSQPAERVDRIKEDPQIKQLVDTLSGLGLPMGDRLDQALRHGAATHEALQKANGEFYLLLGNNTRTVDGPPIPLKSSP